jgi:hypothetical protein
MSYPIASGQVAEKASWPHYFVAMQHHNAHVHVVPKRTTPKPGRLINSQDISDA